MKDKIEKFISENRLDLDDLEPKQSTWESIQKNVRKTEMNVNWVWKVAAVVLLVTTLSLVLERTLVKNNEIMVTDAISPNEELEQVEVYYAGLIHQKQTQIKLVIQQKNLTDVELLEDLEDLDLMYAVLKKDLEQNTNNEKLMNAMIRNLQLRVEILNKQLEILEQLVKHESNEIII